MDLIPFLELNDNYETMEEMLEEFITEHNLTVGVNEVDLWGYSGTIYVNEDGKIDSLYDTDRYLPAIELKNKKDLEVKYLFYIFNNKQVENYPYHVIFYGDSTISAISAINLFYLAPNEQTKCVSLYNKDSYTVMRDWRKDDVDMEYTEEKIDDTIKDVDKYLITEPFMGESKPRFKFAD